MLEIDVRGNAALGEKEINSAGDLPLDQLARAAIWALLIALAVSQILYATRLSNQLTEIIDPFGEANAIRAGDGYVENGFFSNAGLPDTCFGERFPDAGHKGITNENEPSIRYQHQAYTHYPPGPDWLEGLYTLVIGPGRYSAHRMVPILLSLLSMAFFTFTMCRKLGAPYAAAIVFACAAAPMFSRMMHHLHFLSYTLALLLCEFAVLLELNFKQEDYGRRKWLAALGGVAFVQGWFSFDYCFLVVFSPIVFSLLPWPGRREFRIRSVLLEVFIAGAAFTLAHSLHFAQVIAYYGSLQQAMSDFTESANYRAAGGPGEASLLIIARSHFSVLSSQSTTLSSHTFGPMLGAVILLWLALCAVPRNRKAFFMRTAPAVGAAIAVSALWLLIMRGHAVEHPTVLPRHWFLLYFVLVLAVVGEVKRLTLSNDAADHARAP